MATFAHNNACNKACATFFVHSNSIHLGFVPGGVANLCNSNCQYFVVENANYYQERLHSVATNARSQCYQCMLH